MPQLSAEQIAKTTGGEIIGDQNKTISSVAKLDEATSEDLAFFANPKYENQVYNSKCGILFVPENFKASQEITATLIAHENPYFAFCTILSIYSTRMRKKMAYILLQWFIPQRASEKAHISVHLFILMKM